MTKYFEKVISTDEKRSSDKTEPTEAHVESKDIAHIF